MRCSAVLAICLSAFHLSACNAAQHSSGAAQSSAPPLPQMQGGAVVLTNANLPPQGSNFRGQDNRWVVHGVVDGVPYRYGEADPTHLFVANARGVDWTGL